MPDVETILDMANENEVRFNQAIDPVSFDKAGMWFSELFVFAIISEYIGCSRIIESGRSRGVSTKVLSNYFERNEDVEIISIDNRPNSEDSKIAEKKLSNSRNVTLKYGDSREIVPDLITDETSVLIDGPKGDQALRMGIGLLEDEDAPFVAIHDLHKNYFRRELSELLFKHRMYTDDETLVAELKQYDESVQGWYLKQDIETEFGASYGPTLGIFFNSETPVNQRIKHNYYAYSKHDVVSCSEDILKRKQMNGGAITSNLAKILLRFGRAVLK